MKKEKADLLWKKSAKEKQIQDLSKTSGNLWKEKCFYQTRWDFLREQTCDQFCDTVPTTRKKLAASLYIRQYQPQDEPGSP